MSFVLTLCCFKNKLRLIKLAPKVKTKVTVFCTSVSCGIADGWSSYHLYGYIFPCLALFLLPHHPLPPVPRPYWAPCWPHPCWAPSVSGHLHLLFPHLEHSSPRYHQGWFPHLSLCAHISFSERSSFLPRFFKSTSLGTLLEVQWLRLHIPPMQGAQVQSPIGKLGPAFCN